jgi:hypothetical protein
MLNTLANHGFLPHDGRNITKEKAIFAMTSGLGFDPAAAVPFFTHGLLCNPDVNATSFTLWVKSSLLFCDMSTDPSAPVACFAGTTFWNMMQA